MKRVIPCLDVDDGRVVKGTNFVDIRDAGDHLAIGALTRHRDLETSDLLGAECAALRGVAAEVGDNQVRHRGTIGGSVAHGDPASDIPAALLARCSGAGPFFPLAEQLFAAQRDWLGKAQALTAEDQKALQAMTPAQLPSALADKLGLVEFVRQRGIPEEKAKACLADAKAIDALVAMTDKGVREFKVQGTPTFVINGVTQENTSNWELLKPKLIDAGA